MRNAGNRRKPPRRRHVPRGQKTEQTLLTFSAKRRGTPGTDENNHEKRTFPAVKTEQTLRVFPAKRCETPGTDKNHREEINSPILSARPPFRPFTPSGRNPAPRRTIRTTEQKDVSLFLYPILHEFHSFVNTPRTAILINPLNNPLKKRKNFFSAKRAPPATQQNPSNSHFKAESIFNRAGTGHALHRLS
jgi:hypothetical protein